jgi:hypothetical protein
MQWPKKLITALCFNHLILDHISSRQIRCLAGKNAVKLPLVLGKQAPPDHSSDGTDQDQGKWDLFLMGVLLQDSYFAIRPEAIIPDAMVVGTPPPGWVEEPARYNPEITLERAHGRNTA